MAKVIPSTLPSSSSSDQKPAWQSCHYCPLQTFKISPDYVRHLRERHCTKEGGSYVCRYGYNGVCASLPLDGVSDRDYDAHVIKYHVNQMATKPPEWSVFSAAQNLPAVLNDPSRGKQSNLFTKKWGDSFVEKSHIPPTHVLPEISWEHFDGYMKRIGKRYRRHVRYKHVGENLDNAGGMEDDANNSSPQGTHLKRQISELADSSLRNIPQIFMRSQIDLSEPQIFTTVFPGIGSKPVDSDAVPPSAEELKEHAQSSGRILQEKLSYYLDIVEVHIAKQVSQKSSAFFHAMTSQDTIMEQMKEAAANVKKLRSKIQHIDATLVKEALTVISMERRRSNHQAVLEKLKLMATVHQTQPMIQLLLGTQDYVAALDLISTTQEIVAQELIGIHCFRHLPSQLTEMIGLIDKMLTTDFERYATADLNRPFFNDEDERVLDVDKLVCIISGLLRQKNLNFIENYKEEAIVTIKAIVKQLVIEVIASGDAEVCLTGAGEETQNLALSEWIRLLDTATVTLMKVLRRVKSVHDVMLETAHASAGKITEVAGTVIDSDSFLSEADLRTVESRLCELRQSVCNYCHERCANFMSGLKQNQVASSDEIRKLSRIVEEFCQGCESITGVISVPLRAALKVQATRFAQKFHAERKSKLALLLDSERWKQADVPAEFQQLIDRIQEGGDFGSTKRNDDGIVQLMSNGNRFNDEISHYANSDDNNSDVKHQPPSQFLIVDGTPYALVGAALLLVQIVSEYCRCATQLPVIAAQLSLHVIDLLRTFNSRCCQLVLGAGALHVAGLKTITSGNLALVSRALQLVLWLVPQVRAHFQRFDVNGNVSSVGGYDTVAKDYVSHIKENENKVLSIVTALVNGQLNNWDCRPPVPSNAFRNISRQFVKLHEAIAPILPEQQVQHLYRTVHRSFKDKMREQLLRNNIMNNGGPQHGVVISELTFYIQTLRSIRAIPDDELDDDTMDDIWMK